MRKLIKILSMLMAGLMSWFSPVQMANAGMCCAACVLIKEEENKVEYVEEINKDGK
jgi:hypothetical protein|tara:strand:- start:2204 stop:2371 length:168 start_codon:yes stop_codon:yes gene_type:complete